TKTREFGVTGGKLNAVLRRASEVEDVTLLILDVVRITIEVGCSIDTPIQLKDIYIPSLDLCEGMKDCSQLHFYDCYFSKIELDPDLDTACLPRFEACYVDEIEGRSSRKDLPRGVFDDACVLDKFSEAPETTDAIGAMDLPNGAKVLLTILKKVYLQSGA